MSHQNLNGPKAGTPNSNQEKFNLPSYASKAGTGAIKGTHDMKMKRPNIPRPNSKNKKGDETKMNDDLPGMNSPMQKKKSNNYRKGPSPS